MIQLNISEMDRWAFCDPAGNNKRGAEGLRKIRARSAIVVVAVDPALQRIFSIHSWADRCSTDTLVEKLFNVYAQFRPKQFGIEANAMQSLFAAMMLRETRAKGLKVPFVPINQPTKIDKDFRIRTALQKVIADGRLFVPTEQVELLTEIRSFPTGQTKDLVDALASVVAMVPMRTTKARVSEEEESVLRYLRESGAPASVIEARFPRLSRERMIEQLRDDYRKGRV